MNQLLRAAFLTGVGLVVLWAERTRRARSYVEPLPRHAGRNLVVAGIAAGTVHALEAPVVVPVARWVTRRGWGITRALRAPQWVRDAVAVLLLDYTLYLWHVLVHRVPFLWRFHLVHHVDLDLDASTGLRFHAGELTLSIPWRAAQIAAIGVTPQALATWQTLTLASVLFHHSNSALPAPVERAVGWVFVTPRMHAIHHSVDPSQRDANFSSGLAWWDRLHRTLRVDASADQVTIGVEGYAAPEDVALGRLLELPFRPQPRLARAPLHD